MFQANTTTEGMSVLQKKILPTSWGLGLTEEQKQALISYLDDNTDIRFWDSTFFPQTKEMETDTPSIMWLSSKALRTLRTTPAAKIRHLALIPKVVLLDNHYSLKDFEDATDFGAAEIVRPPLSKKRLRSIFARALEVHNVHHDILCMTREIMLEREILERKNELLTFLVSFFSTTAESLDVKKILQKTFDGLGLLFTTKSMHVALFDVCDATPKVSLLINAPTASLAKNKWLEELTCQSKKALGQEVTIGEIATLELNDQPNGCFESLPSDDYMLTLPISLGQEKLGVILLLTETQKSLGRDHALALESAMTHLGLSLKNAKKFCMMQQQADYDALTKVHNRRHFELYIQEEIDCFNRYAQPFSLILTDIDNFKMINDTYGHQTGDIILQEVAALIQNTIRTSDYCARYGGEEFVLLLPHTERAQAFSLAERLRKKLAKNPFIINGQELHITMSLGMSYLFGSKGKTRDELLSEADANLYQAKKEGKNCTRDSSFEVRDTA